MNPTIERAKTTDAAAIADVHVESWREAYADDLPAEFLEGLSKERRAGLWSKWLGEGAPVWVARTGEGVVGFCNVSAARDRDLEGAVGEIQAIYVRKRFWGEGIGRGLLEPALEFLRDDGSIGVVLWVLDTNDRAVRFYERAGFRPDGARKVEDVGGTALPHVRLRLDFGETDG